MVAHVASHADGPDGPTQHSDAHRSPPPQSSEGSLLGSDAPHATTFDPLDEPPLEEPPLDEAEPSTGGAPSPA